VHFGDADGFPAPVNPGDLYSRSIKISAFGLDERHDPVAAATPASRAGRVGRGTRFAASYWHF